MHFQTIGLVCLTLLNTSVFTSLTLSIPVPFSVPQALAQIPDQRSSEADRLYQQGDRQIKASQFKEALQSFGAALAIYQKIGDRSQEAFTLNYIGLAYNNLNQHSQALKFYQQALAIFRELGDRFNEGTVLSNTGGVYDNLSQYSQALKLYDQALAIRTEVNDRDGEGATLNSLGLIYRNLGQYEKARDLYQRALAIRRKLGDPRNIGVTLNNLGEVYRNFNQYPKAVELYQEALTIFRKLGNLTLGEGAILNNLGDAYRYQGQYQKALESFQQAAAIFRKIGARVSEGTTLGNIGRVYAQQSQYQKAIEYYQQALVILRQAGDRVGEVRNLKNMGSALYKSGKFVESTETLHTAIEIFESLRPGLNDLNKVSIFDTQADIYNLQQQALIAQNKINDALEIAERSRTRAFVELLQARLSTNPTFQPPLNSLPITLIQQVAKQQNATLVEYSIVSDNFNIEGKYIPHESELFIWVIKPTGEITFRKSDLKPLWQKQKISLPELAMKSRESIGVRGRGAILVSNNSSVPKEQNQLKYLHELLIKPILDLLPTKPDSHIIFIPQQSLFLIPFPALQDVNGKYLIEKHTVLSAPSIQVLDLTHQQRQQVSSKDVVIVGNPTMPKVTVKVGDLPQQLPQLPGAQKEALLIAPLFHTKAIIGAVATKVAVVEKMKQARIVHLATHGLLDDFKGLGIPGAIALAPSGKDNGLLTADEIFDLKLNTELVVLSACDTGRGKITGDGVIGLSRALISAGVPSVLVSLWSIPDAPTAELMTEFYKNLQQKPDKAAALRQAMLTTIKKHPNPRDWAAFTLIGESQ